MRALGIIPARGGSKGVPRKNVRPVADEPLTVHAIKAAQESRLLTAFFTSTDDDEIASIAVRYGSPVVRRPPDLAGDETPMVPVLLHALEQAEQQRGHRFDVVVLLQPTAPIRTGGDIDAVIAMFERDPAVESVVSVTRTEDAHPARMYRVDADGWMQPLWPDWENGSRQDLPPIHLRNGALYAVRREVLVDRRQLMGDRKKAYVMPRNWLANIDDERDVIVTDVLIRLWKAGRL